MKRAFTIIEMLIVVFIFSIVVMLGSSSIVNAFMSGRLRSTGQKDLNRELDMVMSIIGQKMMNANGSVVVKKSNDNNTLFFNGVDIPSGGTIIYGFGAPKNGADESYDNLMFVSGDGSDRQCTTIDLLSHDRSSVGYAGNTIYIKQEDCPGAYYTYQTVDDPTSLGWSQLTSSNIDTSRFAFDVSQNHQWSKPPGIDDVAPFVTVKITATEAKNSVTATLENTFIMESATLQKFKTP